MNAPAVLSVPADSPYQTLQEFIDGSKEKSLSVANSGAGSIWEAVTFALSDATGAQLEPVPFDGGAPAGAAVAGGQVDAAVSGAGAALTGYEEGQTRVLAIFADEPHPQMSDVPTTVDLGYEDLQFGGWGGVYAPKGLPEEVRATLEEAIKKAANSDSFTETMTKAGNVPVYKSGEEFTQWVNDQYERFGEILGNR